MPLPTLPLAESMAGLLSPTGTSMVLLVLVVVVGIPFVGLLKGAFAAGLTLPYVYREGGWMFARVADGERQRPAPVKHVEAGAALGLVNVVLLLVVLLPVLGVLDGVGLQWLALLAQASVAAVLGGAVLWVNRRAGGDGLLGGRVRELSPTAVKHVGVFLVALVWVDVAMWVLGAALEAL